MAGGVFAVDRTPDTPINVSGKLTLSIFITCIVAASGGLLFGYDVGIS
ncbi:sugar transport protein 5-like, partial [Trifolium pratense]